MTNDMFLSKTHSFYKTLAVPQHSVTIVISKANGGDTPRTETVNKQLQGVCINAPLPTALSELLITVR